MKPVDIVYVQKASALQKGIIEEMSDKIYAINRPKGYSVVPVLFHVGGVAESVEESNFFYRIVDIGDWLQSHNIA